MIHPGDLEKEMKIFSTRNPASLALSKNAISFSNSHGLYGVKNTNALASCFFASVSRIVATNLPCSE